MRVHISLSRFAHVNYRGLCFNQGLKHIPKMFFPSFFSTRLVTQALCKSLRIIIDAGNHRIKERPLYRNRFAPRLHSSPILIVLFHKITSVTDRFFKIKRSAFNIFWRLRGVFKHVYEGFQALFKHFSRRDLNSSTFKHLFMFSSTFQGNPWNSSSFQGCANPVIEIVSDFNEGHIIGFGWEIRKLAFWKLSILDLICCPVRAG